MIKKLLTIAGVLGLSVTTTWGDETNSLSLRQAEELAIQNHPQITASQLIALASEQVVRETRSAYFPVVTANATAVGTTADNTRIAAGGLNNPLILNRQADGVNISQIITDFGRTGNLTESSKLSARAQQENALATRAQILLQVNSTYFSALQAQSVLEVARQTVATRQLLFDRVDELAKNKLRSGLDVSFAQVSLDESQLLLANAQNDLRSEFTVLSNLLGERDQRSYRLLDEPAPANPSVDTEQMVATALQNRPEVAQFRFSRDAAESFARAEKDLSYPTLSAVGSVGVIPVHDSALRANYAAGGVNLSLPIFDGMLFSAREKEAQLRAQASAENLRDLENNVIRDVRIAALNLSYSGEQVALTEKLLASANEAFELAQARYKVGSSSIVELSQAQLSQTQAQIAQARARFEYQIRNAILNFQTGQLK